MQYYWDKRLVRITQASLHVPKSTKITKITLSIQSDMENVKRIFLTSLQVSLGKVLCHVPEGVSFT